MPIDPSRPPKPSWRDPVKPHERKPQAQRDWRKEPAATKPTGKRWTRKRRFALAFVAFLLCGIGLVAVIAMLHPPKGAALVLLGAGYENNLAIPHNAYGMNGLNDLETIARKGPPPSRWNWSAAGQMRLGHGPQTLGAGQPWTKGWDDIDQETIVIFLALHGGTDSKRGAYFLLDDPAGQERLYVSDVLKDLGRLRAKNIVLILDATQAADNWSLGMLHNDFVRQVKDMDPKPDKSKNLVILLASNEGQRSWVSEEWRQTIFTHYVVEGLRGGALKKGETGTITVKVLFDWVQAEVKQWVQLNRGASQEPYLIDPNNKASDIELTVVSTPYAKPDPNDTNHAPGHTFTPPKELAEAWTKYQELAARTLPPYVHSPHRWRRYGETLLRYEQLLRAGDPTGKAIEVSKELATLQGHLTEAEQDLQIKLTSMSHSLPLPQTLGLSSPWKEKDLEDQLNLLSNAANKQDAWKKARAWAGNTGAANLLRMQFDRLLLEEAIANPADNLKKGHDLTNVFYDKSEARPAEINFLTVLDNDLDKNRPAARLAAVTHALRLRRQAEQAALAAQAGDDPNATASHPYSEWIFSSIKAEVDAGDKQRRLGEDLLFPSLESDWKKAEALFTEAQKRYGLASKDAEALRAALTTRDQALAELPAYTRWISREDDAGREEIEDLEKLWADVHSLADDLDLAAAGKPGQPDRAWQARAEAINLRLKVQRDAYQQACAKAAQQADQFPREWRKLEALLSVAALPAGKDGGEVREKLLVNSRLISDGLNVKAPSADKAPPVPTDTTVARDRAQQQGRLALASLGKKWVNQLADAHEKSIPPFDALGNTIRDAQNAWQATLDGAGEQLGDCFQLLSVKIQKNVHDGRNLPAEKAQTLLHDADRWSRSVDAAGAAQLKDNPPDEYRRIRLQGLLLWMADRTVRDYWWDENRSPFYLNGGKAFLSDAKAVALGGTADPPFTPEQKNRRTATDLANKLGGLLDETQKLKVEKDVDKQSGVYWFTDDSLDLKYLLHFPEEFEPGHPVARLNLTSLQLSDAAKAGWTVIDVPAERKSVELRYPVQLTSAAANPKAELELFYRGQKVPTETSVRVQRTPDTRFHEYEEADTGDFAAQIDPSAYQASLVIVLDCSGSMRTSNGKQIDEKKYVRGMSCRYRRATEALRKVLPNIEEGTLVSVLVFGHAEGKTEIEAILKKERWRKDNESQIDKLMDKLEALTPHGFSPIVDTMVAAQEDFLKDFKGLKTLLVLTDGKDEDKSGGTNPKITTNKIQNAFDGSGVTVNVVFLEIDADEKNDADEQFKIVKGLRPAGYLHEIKLSRNKGNDDDEKTTHDLVDRIQWILRPKVRILQRENLVAGMEAQGHRATFVREPNPIWFPGLSSQKEYTAVLPDGTTQNFVLDRGERLWVTVKKKNNTMYAERVLYSDYFAKERKLPVPAPPVSTGEWQLAVLQNEWKSHELNRSPFLQMMVTAEDERFRSVTGADSLRLFKPRFTWLEVFNQADEKPVPVRLDWGTLSGFPATAWTVDAPAWKNSPEAKPMMRAWLWSDLAPPSVTRDLRELSEADLFKPFLVGEQQPHEVTIESVRYEVGRKVQRKPDEPAGAEGCVVVRLRHEPGHPVFVQLRGLEPPPRGAEHSFYYEASKYTAVFWGVTQKQWDDRKFSLNVVSLDDVKNGVKPVNVRLDAPDERQRPFPP